MRLLRPEPDFDGFFSRLAAGAPPVLLLDYDGTLAPFRERRQEARPYPGVPQRLEQLQEAGTKIVLISGRRAAEVRRMLGLRRPVEVWGAHGRERLGANDEYWVAPFPPRAEAALQAIAVQLTASGLPAAVEIKPGSLALHWRGLEPGVARAVKHAALTLWQRCASDARLSLLLFDGGVEFRVSRPHKGDAVNAICNEAPPDAAIAYLGDDLTDEDAFRALRGRGLTVLVRPEFRETLADLWLAPPDELDEFLNLWLTTTGGATCRTLQ
jgi:trehalose 6-phosphate phosphatase